VVHDVYCVALYLYIVWPCICAKRFMPVYFYQDNAVRFNVAYSLACTYNGENSCGTNVDINFFAPFVSYQSCMTIYAVLG